MLWANGQKRLWREERARMTEGYVFMRDALVEVVGAALGDKTRRPAPAYTAPEDARRSVGLTGAELDRALASWQLEYPDRVN